LHCYALLYDVPQFVLRLKNPVFIDLENMTGLTNMGTTFFTYSKRAIMSSDRQDAPSLRLEVVSIPQVSVVPPIDNAASAAIQVAPPGTQSFVNPGNGTIPQVPGQSDELVPLTWRQERAAIDALQLSVGARVRVVYRTRESLEFEAGPWEEYVVTCTADLSADGSTKFATEYFSKDGEPYVDTIPLKGVYEVASFSRVRKPGRSVLSMATPKRERTDDGVDQHSQVQTPHDDRYPHSVPPMTPPGMHGTTTTLHQGATPPSFQANNSFVPTPQGARTMATPEQPHVSMPPHGSPDAIATALAYALRDSNNKKVTVKIPRSEIRVPQVLGNLVWYAKLATRPLMIGEVKNEWRNMLSTTHDFISRRTPFFPGQQKELLNAIQSIVMTLDTTYPATEEEWHHRFSLIMVFLRIGLTMGISLKAARDVEVALDNALRSNSIDFELLISDAQNAQWKAWERGNEHHSNNAALGERHRGRSNTSRTVTMQASTTTQRGRGVNSGRGRGSFRGRGQ
jgi:hypothetical protein